jgi:carboxyl-terminal processing protease
MGSKKLQIWLPVMFSIVMIVGMLIGFKLKEQTGSSSFLKWNNKDDVQQVIDLVKSKYVDSVQLDSLNEVAINAILSKLDPHSVFIPLVKVTQINEEMMGSFQGIGVEYIIIDDTITISKVLPNGPSERAGLQIGDAIVAVNDTIQLTNKTIKADDVRTYLRGKAGSTVRVSIFRNGQYKKVNIIRGNIPVKSVDAAYMVSDTIGYVHINRFAERTYEEFMQSMEALQKQGMKSLILDVRNNGGGLLQQAVKIADEFLDEDKLIVYTEGNKSAKEEYRCRKEGLFEKGKLIVVVNELSASASEVLSGALQDWDRATIVGRRTFGKGLVQQQFPLADGSALRLTTARYYTPLGRNIQKSYKEGKGKYEQELINRYHDGEVMQADTIKPNGPSFKTLKGHIVYGGGGITPDVFVPLDTTKYLYAYSSEKYKNLLHRAAIRWYKNHIKEITTFTNATEFNAQFAFSENEWQQLQQAASKDSINGALVSNQFKGKIIGYIKVLIAMQLWDMNGYYMIENKEDNVIIKSIDLLK